MQIAVISDIHGNDLAFGAVVTDFRADSIAQVVCCGDALQGGVQPVEVIRRLKELDCPVVMGNADDLLLRGKESTNVEPTDEWIDAVFDACRRRATHNRLFGSLADLRGRSGRA